MKSIEERLLECLNIRIQLRNMGIEAHHKDDLGSLFQVMSVYTREGTFAQGNVKVPAAEFRSIEYFFSSKPGVECFCRVRK